MKKILSSIISAALSALFLAVPNSATAAAGDSISLYFSAPFVTGSHVTESATTESFNGLATGVCTSNWALSTWVVTGTGCFINGNTEPSTGNSEPAIGVPNSRFADTWNGSSNSTMNINVSFPVPVKYVGLWWLMGSNGNTVNFRNASNQVVATMNTSDIITFLGTGGSSLKNNDAVTKTRVDGSTVLRKRYYRDPSSYTGTVANPVMDYEQVSTWANEPWVYLNLFVAGNVEIKSIDLQGSGFEFDNLTVSTAESGPRGDMVLAKNILGTPPTGQTISWNPTNSDSGTSATLTPSQAATVTTPGSGGGAISYSVVGDTPWCTVNSSSGVITRTQAGNCTVRATAAAVTAAGTDYYSASKDVTFSFTSPLPPTITSVSPNTGLTTGGTTITITGTGFAAGATASVGGSVCSSPVVVPTTSITCSTPSGTAGAKDVIVTNTDSGTVTSAGAFTYTAPVVNNPGSGSSVSYRSVLFDSNSGTGTTPTLSNYTATALPAHSLVKPGFVFTSWNTKADGTGIAYADKGTYSFDTDLTLYAQWVPVKAAVKVKQYIATFAGDKPVLTTKMRSTIAGWVKKLPKDSVITCQGSTSGSKVTAFDKRLASNRAKNVCVEAVKKRSDLTYSIQLNPSSATKVSARHVWMIQN